MGNSEYTRFSNVLSRFENDKIVGTVKARDSIQVSNTTSRVIFYEHPEKECGRITRGRRIVLLRWWHCSVVFLVVQFFFFFSSSRMSEACGFDRELD